MHYRDLATMPDADSSSSVLSSGFGFYHKPVNVGVVVDVVALGQVFLRVFWFPLVSVTPPAVHTQSYITDAIYRSADKSLARPGRKQPTATEDFEFHISYL